MPKKVTPHPRAAWVTDRKRILPALFVQNPKIFAGHIGGSRLA